MKPRLSQLVAGWLVIAVLGLTVRTQTTIRTPGQLALLANQNTMDADAMIAVQDAITSDDQLIRTVAARIATATRHLADETSSRTQRAIAPRVAPNERRAGVGLVA